jgi:glycosyltransferase involved in cell wall biosynthesis
MVSISVLIPVYNVNIHTLVSQLHSQCKSEKIEFEILIIDDCSSDAEIKAQNREFCNSLAGVRYTELPSNIGRSAIRNRLAEQAKHEFLLFLDCDVAVSKSDYIKSYINKLTGATVISGGTAYEQTRPLDKKFLLHWKAGTYRENLPIHVKKKNLIAGFSLNNLLIKRTLFLSIKLDESLHQYGHEDTLFGLMLINKNIYIDFIANPVFHLGLNDTISFINKNKQAINNLIKLEEKGIIIPTKLYKIASILSKYKLVIPVIYILSLIEPFLYKQLIKNTGNLFYFDMIKLHYYLVHKKWEK